MNEVDAMAHALMPKLRRRVERHRARAPDLMLRAPTKRAAAAPTSSVKSKPLLARGAQGRQPHDAPGLSTMDIEYRALQQARKGRPLARRKATRPARASIDVPPAPPFAPHHPARVRRYGVEAGGMSTLDAAYHAMVAARPGEMKATRERVRAQRRRTAAEKISQQRNASVVVESKRAADASDEERDAPSLPERSPMRSPAHAANSGASDTSARSPPKASRSHPPRPDPMCAAQQARRRSDVMGLLLHWREDHDGAEHSAAVLAAQTAAWCAATGWSADAQRAVAVSSSAAADAAAALVDAERVVARAERRRQEERAAVAEASALTTAAVAGGAEAAEDAEIDAERAEDAAMEHTEAEDVDVMHSGAAGDDVKTSALEQETAEAEALGEEEPPPSIDLSSSNGEEDSEVAVRVAELHHSASHDAADFLSDSSDEAAVHTRSAPESAPTLEHPAAGADSTQASAFDDAPPAPARVAAAAPRAAAPASEEPASSAAPASEEPASSDDAPPAPARVAAAPRAAEATSAESSASDDGAAQFADATTPAADALGLDAAEDAKAPHAIDSPVVRRIVLPIGRSSPMQPNDDDSHLGGGREDESSSEYEDALDTSLAASWGMPRKCGDGGDGGGDDHSTEAGVLFAESALHTSGGSGTTTTTSGACEGRVRIKTKLAGVWKNVSVSLKWKRRAKRTHHPS